MTLIIIAMAVLLTAFAVWVIWANSALKLTKYNIKIENLPEELSGFRIVQVSDLHNDEFGKDNCKLLEIIKNARPDIIALTGDLIDCRQPNIGVSLKFAENATKIAPCYYVSGNHEARIPEYRQAKADFTALGVILLENESVNIHKNGKSIVLLGVDDPRFKEDNLISDIQVMEEQISLLERGRGDCSVLLSHRPELFDVYAKYKFNLVLSGHTHGGHIRLPFIGGIFAPYQGIFPKYDSGSFKKNSTEMIVSRGIKKSSVPPRFLNRPEIVLIELEN